MFRPLVPLHSDVQGLCRMQLAPRVTSEPAAHYIRIVGSKEGQEGTEGVASKRGVAGPRLGISHQGPDLFSKVYDAAKKQLNSLNTAYASIGVIRRTGNDSMVYLCASPRSYELIYSTDIATIRKAP